MALGRKAVNVPYDIQDVFIQAGLAHTLAASGFHVSLVLGVVLGVMSHPALADRFRHPTLAKVIAGFAALAGYVVLTGGQPSVLRALADGGRGADRSGAGAKGEAPGLFAVSSHPSCCCGTPHGSITSAFVSAVMATLGLIVSVKPPDRLDGMATHNPGHHCGGAHSGLFLDNSPKSLLFQYFDNPIAFC